MFLSYIIVKSGLPVNTEALRTLGEASPKLKTGMKEFERNTAKRRYILI